MHPELKSLVQIALVGAGIIAAFFTGIFGAAFILSGFLGAVHWPFALMLALTACFIIALIAALFKLIEWGERWLERA